MSKPSLLQGRCLEPLAKRPGAKFLLVNTKDPSAIKCNSWQGVSTWSIVPFSTGGKGNLWGSRQSTSFSWKCATTSDVVPRHRVPCPKPS
eukprot:11514359-Prorocentrum_lima.AAC.1